MNKLKAEEMIQKQRRRWRSQDSDMAIARRAERVYLALGGAFLCIASSFIVLYQHSGLLPKIGGAGFYIGAVIFFWHSRRFGQIRKLLADSDAKTDPH
jgi:hypothetical protein